MELESRVRELENRFNTEIIPEDELRSCMLEFNQYKTASDARVELLKELDAKVDKLLVEISEIKINQLKEQNELENRITALESSQKTAYQLIAIVGVILAVLEFALKFII